MYSEETERLWIDGAGTLSAMAAGDDHASAALKACPEWRTDGTSRALHAGWIRVNASVRDLAIALDPDRVTAAACRRALALLARYRVGGVFMDLVPTTLSGEPIVGFVAARQVLVDAQSRARRRLTVPSPRQ